MLAGRMEPSASLQEAQFSDLGGLLHMHISIALMSLQSRLCAAAAVTQPETEGTVAGAEGGRVLASECVCGLVSLSVTYLGLPRPYDSGYMDM